MFPEIQGYELIPSSWGHINKINNILIANNIRNDCIQICARYNYTTAVYMWVLVPDRPNMYEEINKAVEALQKKFGPGLTVHDNYAQAKTLRPLNMLTTTEAAAILDVNPSYVRRLLKNERLKGVRHGRDWLIERGALGKIEKLKVGRPAKA